jgi:hypothetical protein
VEIRRFDHAPRQSEYRQEEVSQLTFFISRGDLPPLLMTFSSQIKKCSKEFHRTGPSESLKKAAEEARENAQSTSRVERQTMPTMGIPSHPKNIFSEVPFFVENAVVLLRRLVEP